MGPGNLILLGVIAGVTIFLGMPIGRMRSPSTRLRTVLTALTVGILIFLLWDVLSAAVEPIEAALHGATSAPPAAGGGGWLSFFGLAGVFFAALIVGLIGLVAYDKFIGARAEFKSAQAGGTHTGGVLRLAEPASRLAFLIAVGIGLHNFSEGLAIGQSAASGKVGFALVLVIGFGLHNATEGFGITAPLAGGGTRPSWGQLAILGLIGGGPTVVGTLLGSVWVNDVVSIAFLALAAGSILYVVIQLIAMAFKATKSCSIYLGILAGVIAGFATDFVVTAAGV